MHLLMDIVTDERIELMTGSVWNIQETTGRLSCTGLGKHPRTDDCIRNVTIDDVTISSTLTFWAVDDRDATRDG